MMLSNIGLLDLREAMASNCNYAIASSRSKSLPKLFVDEENWRDEFGGISTEIDEHSFHFRAHNIANFMVAPGQTACTTVDAC